MANARPAPSIAQLLLEAAKQDLAACQVLANAPAIGDAMVGFHAQQAVEKALKAVLSAQGIAFRRTHDLVTLLDLLQDHNMPVPPGADWLDELNPYAVEARYGTVTSTGFDRVRVVDAVIAVLAWAADGTAQPPKT